MDRLNINSVTLAILLVMATFKPAFAGEVKIIAADLHRIGSNSWSVNVTLQHGDTGWDHYANNWRVVDGEGNILGDRVLAHPHVDEQPFTRGLSDVEVPLGLTTVYIEAHDSVHGWTPNRLQVEMDKLSGGRLQVEAQPMK